MWVCTERCAEGRLQGDYDVGLHRPFKVFVELLDTYKPALVPLRNAVAFPHLPSHSVFTGQRTSRVIAHGLQDTILKFLAIRKRKIFLATEQSLARESTAKVDLLYNNDLPAQSGWMDARCACLHSWHLGG